MPPAVICTGIPSVLISTLADVSPLEAFTGVMQ